MPLWSSNLAVKSRDDREAVRLDVRMRGSLRRPLSSWFDIEVIDLSTKGCRIDTSAILSEGDSVWIKFPRLRPLETHVLWRDEFRYGCEFTQPLHIAVFDHIARKHSASKG